MELFGWMGTICAIVGALLLSQKKRCGFWVFMAYNIAWIVHGIYLKDYSMIALMLAYMAININGLIKWKE